MSHESTWEKLKKILGFGPDCQNEGSKLLSGECLCPEFYEGKLCERIVCANDGKPNSDKTSCVCPDITHYRGKHCEELLCENGGNSKTDGTCDCLDNWYSGKFCEHYSSPWGIIFGVMGAVLVFLVVVCVLCRLYPFRGRRRRRSGSSSEDSESRRSHRPRDRRSRDLENSSSFYWRRRPQEGRQPRASGSRHGTTPPRGSLVWPPWPPNSRSQTTLPTVDVVPVIRPSESTAFDLWDKFTFPPPSYDEVIRDSERYPMAPPPFSVAIGQESLGTARRQISEDERRPLAHSSPHRDQEEESTELRHLRVNFETDTESGVSGDQGRNEERI